MPAKGHTSSVYRKRDQGSASRGLVCKQPAPCPKGPGNQGQVKWCHMVPDTKPGNCLCILDHPGIRSPGHTRNRPTSTHADPPGATTSSESSWAAGASQCHHDHMGTKWHQALWAKNFSEVVGYSPGLQKQTTEIPVITTVAEVLGEVVEDHGGPMPAPKKSLAMSSLWFPWGFSLKICLPNPFSSPSQQHPLLLPEEEGKNGPVEHQTGQEPTPGRATCFIAGEKIKKKNLAKYRKLSH